MKKNIITTIIVLAISSFTFAQNSRMGSASSTQLLIVPGAKYLSGGGAAASATGMDAAFWNPAGLAMSETGIDAIFSNRQYIDDIENSFFGLSTNIGEYRFAFSVRSFNMGDIKETTVFSPDGTGQVFTPNFSILGGSMAKKLSENTSVGLTANFVRESFGRVSASGVAYDLGVQYKNLIGREGLNVGFALKNFGSPVKYDGPGLGVFAEPSDADRPNEYYKVESAAFDLPFTFDMAITYNISGVDLGATYTSNYYSTDELKLNAGYKFEGLGSVGVGFQTSGAAQEIEHHDDDDHDHGDDDWYTNPADGVSFGASLDMSRFVGMNLSVDYSMLPMGDFGTNSIIALRISF